MMGERLPAFAKALENNNRTGNCACKVCAEEKPLDLVTGLKGRQINALQNSGRPLTHADVSVAVQFSLSQTQAQSEELETKPVPPEWKEIAVVFSISWLRAHLLLHSPSVGWSWLSRDGKNHGVMDLESYIRS